MKSVGISEKYGWPKYTAHQVAYSLLNREFEWELMPLGIDQKVGTFIWGGLVSGQLTGKFRRNQPAPADNRIAQGGGQGPEAPRELLYSIVDVLDEIAKETEKTVAQVALNWLLQRPTVTSVVIGARSEEQLKQNFAAAGWHLTKEQVGRLDKVSAVPKTYPYWHQAKFSMLVPPAV
jgi:aryl-alcohol dehydrogenase-like predicted oxidoreductase